jgi:hypothetical protein
MPLSGSPALLGIPGAWSLALPFAAPLDLVTARCGVRDDEFASLRLGGRNLILSLISQAPA